MSDSIVAVDIGGTHARFALAEVAGGKVVSLDEALTLKTAEHASLQTAWEDFARQTGSNLPRAAAIAVASPIRGDVIKLTNNPWIIRPALIGEKLRVDAHVLVNDFEAVGHAVAQAEPHHFTRLAGPDRPLPEVGTISIVGPGTGLGVAHILRHRDADGASAYHVQATEGGHVDFAPLDAIEDALLKALRQRHRRVSVERIVSGPGIVDIYQTLAAIEDRAVHALDDRTLWQMGTSGEDSLAAAAVDRFCMALGSVAGDVALAQGRQRGSDCRGTWPAHQGCAADIGLCDTVSRQGQVRGDDGCNPRKADHPPATRPVRRGCRLCSGEQPMTADIAAIMQMSPVIPVLVIDDVAHAVPVAQALVAGGLRVLEVTLRTACALDAITAMARVPGAIVGAGTVLNPADLAAAIDAGSQFIVSPGLTEALGRAAVASGVPFLPGIANAGDIMRGLDMGLSHFKFFPAETSGGRAALKALAGPFGGVKFCPTGGITRETARDWLALEPVLCVGGSWLVPRGKPDIEAIEASARQAAGFV